MSEDFAHNAGDGATPPVKPRWSLRSIGLITLVWLILQVGGLFSPGLLDDVDSVYLEIAREMLHRHDYVTPYIDGIRFFDKPPLMYWLAAGSMRLFGETDWAGRIPLALAVLALLLSVYFLGLRLYAQASPTRAPDRAAFYSAIALATAVGPYLYTRFYIPDILIALWMTLGVHLFLLALEKASTRDSLLPCLLFAATLALNLLTKGFIGLVFPLAFVFLYLLLTRQLRLLPKLHLLPSLGVFAAIALPWHILAALRNPAIPMPPGLGLPTRAGWAWFYLYNEHFARFLGKRIPHDYGNTPVPLFWLYTAIWIFPWVTFLPAAVRTLRDHLGHHLPVTARQREAALTVTLWTLTVLVFFSISHRQEYYSLPALPALALMAGSILARADKALEEEALGVPHVASETSDTRTVRSILIAHRYLLLPLTTLVAIICAFFALTAPKPAPSADLSTLLASNPELYNLSLGHLFDLTGAAMGLFRLPLALTALGMLTLGLASYLIRAHRRTYAANLTLATGMIVVLLAAHEGLVRFYPILGSKYLALTIKAERRPGDRLMIDGWLTWGSTLLFYADPPVSLVNGRIYGPWFGSFWPDSPAIFETDESLRRAWSGPARIILLTFDDNRISDLKRFGPVYILSASGGKKVLSNRQPRGGPSGTSNRLHL